MTGQSKLGPTHVCPRCGEWWDVEQEAHENWLVANLENEAPLVSKVWAEEACEPVCPMDTCVLCSFNIAFS
jgi:hypothetical protein